MHSLALGDTFQTMPQKLVEKTCIDLIFVIGYSTNLPSLSKIDTKLLLTFYHYRLELKCILLADNSI